MLKATDHRRIAAAIAAAGLKTSGEIYCVVTDEVSKYREVPIAWGAAAALIAPPALLLLGLRPWTLGDFGSGWSDVPNLGEVVSATLAIYAIGQAALFALAAFVTSIPDVRRRLTPRFLKAHRVKRTAYAHFASTGLNNAKTRTGVLIFASMKDRVVELIADDAIHAEVGDKAWNAAVQALVRGVRSPDPAAGFIQAIEICADALAVHFPPTGEAHDHGDGVIELS